MPAERPRDCRAPEKNMAGRAVTNPSSSAVKLRLNASLGVARREAESRVSGHGSVSTANVPKSGTSARHLALRFFLEGVGHEQTTADAAAAVGDRHAVCGAHQLHPLVKFHYLLS